MIQLRPYQDRAVNELRTSYQSGRRAPLLVAPTGSGKTCIAAHIIESAGRLGNRALFVAPRRELIGQTVRKLADAGVHDVRVIQAKNDTGREDAPVIVGSIQTLTLPRWLGKLPAADLVIADEAHHMAAEQWSQLATAYPRARWLGLTATPERADGKALGDIFDDLIVAATVRELMDLHAQDPTQGLVPCRVFCPAAGELESGELAIDPVAAYRDHGDGELAVAFGITVEQAERDAAAFNAAGIPAAVVEGRMPSTRRGEILRAWADGSPRVVCNVGVLTEGFDLPALSVAILARRFGHAGLYLQCIGRVLRPSPGKHRAVVVDLCGSALKHGPPDMEREYSLDGKAISGPKRDAIRQCARCGAVFLAGPTGCPTCGGELPRRPVEPPRVLGVELVELGQQPVVRAPRLQSIVAAHSGRCIRCAGAIRPGERILWAEGQPALHAGCGVAA